MRNETRVALSIIGLSAITTGYLLGHQSNDAGLALSASANTSAPTKQANPSLEPQVAEDPTPTIATPQPSSEAIQPEPSVTASAEPSPTATQAPQPNAQDGTSGVSGSFQSDSISYKYGQVQVEIVLDAGVLTDVNLLQATTKGQGYEQAPPLLVEAALAAGGSNFGNLSGATFTTEAFKSALDQAFSKAGL